MDIFSTCEIRTSDVVVVEVGECGYKCFIVDCADDCCGGGCGDKCCGDCGDQCCDDQSKGDSNKKNRSLIASTSLDKENIVGGKESLPPIESKSTDKSNNGSIYNDNNNVNTVTIEDKVSDANVNTPISYPDTHTIGSTTTDDANFESLNDQTSPVQSPSTSSPSSLNFSTSTPKTTPVKQLKNKNVSNKNVVTGRKISKRYSKRRSILLRSKTKKKQQDLSGITPERKQDDLDSCSTTATTSSKK
ncbi:unnamed protein product [Rotaria sp. Silwood1]|nr:unnamed protein product [Rotaria sp. Silwood1]CAF4868807.1 unnamed protein product [Rotaria sp. Silwood1]